MVSQLEADAQRAAAALGVDARISPKVSTVAELVRGTGRPRAAQARRAGGVDRWLPDRPAPRIIDWAARERVPAIYPTREFTQAGGLASYAARWAEAYAGPASDAAASSKGARAGELPIEQPTAYELVLNLKTARAQGITLPAAFTALAARGDRAAWGPTFSTGRSRLEGLRRAGRDDDIRGTVPVGPSGAARDAAREDWVEERDPSRIVLAMATDQRSEQADRRIAPEQVRRAAAGDGIEGGRCAAVELQAEGGVVGRTEPAPAGPLLQHHLHRLAVGIGASRAETIEDALEYIANIRFHVNVLLDVDGHLFNFHKFESLQLRAPIIT